MPQASSLRRPPHGIMHTMTTNKMVRIDARGEVCPTPLMMATQALKAAAPEDAVQVIIDYAPSLDTIPPQARRLGWDASVEPTDESEWTITLTRSP